MSNRKPAPRRRSAPKQTAKPAAKRGKPAKKTAKNKLSPQAIVAIVLVVIVLLAAVAGIVAAVMLQSKNKISVTYKGTTYSADAGGLVFAPGDELLISDREDVILTVTAVGNEKNNFTFTVNEEPFDWISLNGEDLTGGFTFEETGEGFRISYESLTGILSGAMQSASVKITSEIPDEDLFKLEIISGKHSLELGFRLQDVASIEPNPPAIVY